MKLQSLESAIGQIQSGHRVFIHGGAATPHKLIEELVRQHARLQNVELIHLHTEGNAAYAAAQYSKSFKVTNLFLGANMRPFLDFDRVDYLPCFLSEIPNLFRSGKRKIDVALIHVSPPDLSGFCSLGVSVDVAKAACDVAPLIIAQVNSHMPRVHGDGFVSVRKISAFVEADVPLKESLPRPLTAEEKQIGAHVASLIEDGSTLQFGIGGIPDAVANCLTNHKDLGLHTEMWSDGTLALIQKGVINNSRKVKHRGRSVSSFVTGSQAVFKYIHDNPSVVQLESSYVNHPTVIAKNPKMVAINSAVEVDLTGQVCADSVGHRIVSGVGGQMDFIRGASLSEGGRPIIALTSRTKKGVSRIVPHLSCGAGVVTTRAHVHFVITEYGIADLYGKTIGERAKELIRIAHPDDRANLEKKFGTRASL